MAAWVYDNLFGIIAKFLTGYAMCGLALNKTLLDVSESEIVELVRPFASEVATLTAAVVGIIFYLVRFYFMQKSQRLEIRIKEIELKNLKSKECRNTDTK